ncbi:MAG: InlB B-repeat-containing protein [Bacilli bacterium]
MEKNNKKVILTLSIVSALTLLLAVVGITYAYFTANVIGNDKASSMIVNTGTLSVDFIDGPQISLPNAMPGASVTKTFKVINTGTVPVHYNIRWDKVVNTFATKSDLVYEVKRSTGKVITGEAVAPEFNEYLPGATDLIINKDEMHEYTFKITFKETGAAQNDNQGKSFSGMLQVLEFKAGEADSLVIESPVVNGLNLTASLKDNRNSVVGYAVTYDSGLVKTSNNNKYSVKPLNNTSNNYKVTKVLNMPTTWIKVDKTSSFNVNITLKDYDATLWVKNEAGIIKYQDLTPYSNLIVNPDGGTWETFTTPQTYNLKYKATKNISNPTKTGYSFSNWAITGTNNSTLSGTTFTMGEKETTLKAVYTSNKYNLTVNPEGGIFDGKTAPSVYNLDYNGTKVIEDPTKEGYTFTGWTKSSTLSTLNSKTFTMGAEPCTLTASWQVNTYPYITYHNKQNVSGTGYTLVTADTEEKSAAFGSTVTPSTKTYAGFTSPSAQSLTIKTSANTLNYNYNRNKYDLVVNPSSGSYNGQTTNTTYNIYYEAVQALSTPIKTGYNFASWAVTGSGTLTDNNLKQGVGSTTLTASYTPQVYTVNYNANGGTVSPASTTVTYDGTYGTLATPVRANYEFLGWFTDQTNGTKIEASTKVTITAAQTIYAHWKEIFVTRPIREAIMANNTVRNVDNDSMFGHVAPADKSENGLWKEARAGKTENNQPTYFFRGSVQNNYVSFAGKMWRIVRINEDGTVKLILGGNSTEDGYIDSARHVWNPSWDQATYVNYVGSTVKTDIEMWYNNNITGANNNKAATWNVCNDKSGTSDSYGGRTRLYNNNTPQFKCPNASDNIATKGGLLTADEVAYAGGILYSESPDYYLYDNANRSAALGCWWLSSSFYFYNGFAFVFSVDGSFNPGFLFGNNVNGGLGLRAVISLASDTLTVSGNGTKVSPYVI